MSANRIWIAGTVIVVIAVVALGWVLGMAPKFAEAGTADRAAGLIDAENAVHQQDLLALQKQFEEIDDVRDELEELQLSLPTTADLPNFILQLNALASTHGVVISSITTSDAENYSPAVATPAAAGTTGTDATDSGTADEAATDTATTGAGAVVDGAKSVTSENFILIPIVITVEGSLEAVLNFTDGLQSGDRLFLVQSLTFAPSAETPTAQDEDEPAPAALYKGELGGQIYVLLGPDARSKSDKAE